MCSSDLLCVECECFFFLFFTYYFSFLRDIVLFLVEIVVKNLLVLKV
jgi:hypothetical protein